MKGITIATFISNNENENKEFYKLTEYLNKYINTQIIIFSSKEIKSNGSKFFITPQMTKYRRIQILLNEAVYDDILCLDNDITPKGEPILKFIRECLNKDYSIAWGKVKAQNIKGFVPKLIDIDKNLSHNYIRPTLWNLNIGISLPGQIFMINKRYLKDELPNIDTVYDDLMIGAIVREKKYPIYFTKDILGYERPKKNIKQLLKQRVRWAKGLAETIMYNKKSNAFPYILLHGFSFNLLWIPLYMFIFGLFKINYILGLIVVMTISYFLTEKKIKKILWALMYMIVFPFIYVIWGISLVFNLVKIEINIKRKANKKIWIKNLKLCYKRPASMLKKDS